MPKLAPVQIQPPGDRIDSLQYRRRFSEQVNAGFVAARETLNQVSELESLAFVIAGTVSNGTYPVGILPANRTVKALWHGLRAGTCTATISHGPTGSEADIDWDGLSPAADVPVTTTLTQELPASTSENVALGTWVIVEITSASGASGLALTLHLT